MMYGIVTFPGAVLVVVVSRYSFVSEILAASWLLKGNRRIM